MSIKVSFIYVLQSNKNNTNISEHGKRHLANFAYLCALSSLRVKKKKNKPFPPCVFFGFTYSHKIVSHPRGRHPVEWKLNRSNLAHHLLFLLFLLFFGRVISHFIGVP